MNCFYCGILTQKRKENQPDTRTRDHLTPKARGGGGSPKNLVIACRKCNGDKGGLTLEEYRAVISLRFGSPVKFWGEGHVALPVQRETVPVAPRQPKPMRLPGALLVVAPKFRAVSGDDSQHKRKLGPEKRQPGEIVLGPDGAVWLECPPIDRPLSAKSPLTGMGFGRSLRCIGVIDGVKSKAKYACQCACGNFTARSSSAIRNPKNTLDACGCCRDGNWMKFNYPYSDQYQRERWEDDGGIAA